MEVRFVPLRYGILHNGSYQRKRAESCLQLGVLKAGFDNLMPGRDEDERELDDYFPDLERRPK